MSDEYDYQLKIILVGNSCTGKSSLCKQLITKKFNVNQAQTIGVDFFSKTFEIVDKKYAKKIRYKTHIWDTAGQEVFNSLITSYYKKSNGILLVFDLNNNNSFSELEKWYNQISIHAPEYSSIMLIGNKCDLQQTVSDSDIDNFCKKYKIPYLITTSTDFRQTQNCFLELVKHIHDNTYIHNNVREIKQPLRINYSYSSRSCC